MRKSFTTVMPDPVKSQAYGSSPRWKQNSDSTACSSNAARRPVKPGVLPTRLDRRNAAPGPFGPRTCEAPEPGIEQPATARGSVEVVLFLCTLFENRPSKLHPGVLRERPYTKDLRFESKLPRRPNRANAPADWEQGFHFQTAMHERHLLRHQENREQVRE